MRALAHEDVLRNKLRFRRIQRDLLGAKSRCLLTRGDRSLPQAIGLVRFDPQAALERFGADDGLSIVEELAVHAAFEPAKDLCLYLAAEPTATSSGPQERLGRTIFFHLKAVQCAIEGGQYERARSCLHQTKRLSQGLLRGGDVQQLLRANTLLLEARLYQVCQRPEQSLELLQPLLASGSGFGTLGPPLHLEWMRIRSAMDDKRDRKTAARLLQELSQHRPVSIQNRRPSLYGIYARHYYFYLAAELHLRLGHPDQCAKAIEQSRAALADLTHARLPAAMTEARAAFLDLLAGRLSMGRAGAAHAPLEDAVKAIHEARSRFRSVRFAPGEYLALRALTDIETAEPTYPSPSPARQLRLHKQARRVAERTQVPVFELESRLKMAEISCRLGMLDSVAWETDNIQKLRDGAREELDAASERLNLRHRLERLRGQIPGDPERNAVDPGAVWGVSGYAREERDEVMRLADMKNRDEAVVVYAPPGETTAAILFGDRVEALRQGRQHALVVVQSVEANDVDRWGPWLRDGRPVRFEHFDLLTPPVQQRVMSAIQNAFVADGRSATGRVYFTLSRPWAGCLRALCPDARELMRDKVWEDVPFLKNRPEDVLPLFRGMLRQKMRGRTRPGLDGVEKLTFMGEASIALLETFSTRSMDEMVGKIDILAGTLKPSSVIVYPDGRNRITLEALFESRVIGGGREPRRDPDYMKVSLEELKTASDDRVRELARHFKTKSALCRQLGCGRSAVYSRLGSHRRQIWDATNEGAGDE